MHVIDRFGFKNVIKHPTRVTATTKTLLDVTIISDTSKLVKAGVSDTGIADHRLNYTVLKLSRNRMPPRTREVRNWKKCKKANFKEKLKSVPWNTCNIFDDIDDNYWMMEKLYKDVSTEFLPKRKVKMRSKSLPWINKRYKLLKQAQKTKDPEDFEKYIYYFSSRRPENFENENIFSASKLLKLTWGSILGREERFWT